MAKSMHYLVDFAHFSKSIHGNTEILVFLENVKESASIIDDK